ncbi:MAG: ribonuclease HII [Candidatus Komeilibacteria bacterium CG_4_9_14_0_8_um_filter_36_9]|uniref:Ribonuclease HII n=1 Tax=Candidatus Komeilibacteria bacterium CG_4_9_14_0_8_um_filter_36_9 TaxID=1974473 RepID=A0A2M8DPY6_9BACT|nr:MAG: ribonuclease HII [Candidatus Komeilibacteria bacterium CG_4_9_14_0_8_um_filter_36_9]
MNKVIVAGIDEVGRGAWAGPIVAAAVVFLKPNKLKVVDSKQLNFAQREKLSKEIKRRAVWSLGIVSSFDIDRLGLQKANILAAQRAANNLPIKPDLLKVDMIRKFTHPIDFELIIRGDSKVREISAASIIAKDHRDKMMIELHQHYKHYRFDLHKGYGTELHQQLLKQYGASVLHRTSFAPIARLTS